MNIHLFGGLAFLGLIVVFIFCYILTGYAVVVLINLLIRAKRIYTSGGSYRQCLPGLVTRRHFRILYKVFFVLLLINTLFYLRQRSEWMGEENANLTAKEYYVAGQVLYFYRAMASNLIYPGKYLWLRPFEQPLDWLQEKIYNQGIKYLPEDDGEIGVWGDVWFIYPYSKKLRIPYYHSPDVYQYLPIASAFLDKVWFNLESMATKPFCDRKMYEQYYLRNFAGMAHFYAYRKHEYVVDGGREYAQNPAFISKDEQLVGWLLELKEKWGKEEKVQRFLKQNPKVEVMRQVAMLMELVDIIDGRVWARKFDCNDPLFKLYADVRKEFAEGEGKAGPAFKRMANRKEAGQFYEVAVNSVIARFAKYVLKKYCAVDEVAGQADMELYTGRMQMTPEQYEERKVRTVLFSPEIKLIEEQINE